MVKKTIKDLDFESEQIEVMELSTNWEEDDIFLRTLFDECVEKELEYEKYFEHLLKNWEVERTAMMDRIIITMAIAEMLNFPGIPVKVTINEYIEISKLYSTPKSKQFINGVLDAVGTELKEKGILKKSGRGLIDNK
jgi:N utilization substance protein B